MIAVMASSCSIYRKYHRPEDIQVNVDSLYRSELIANPEDTVSFGSMPWEELFTDPYLKDLIDSGLVHNTDLQTAILRVQQAQDGLYAARWAYSPSLNLSPQGSVSSIDGNKATFGYNLGGAVSWDIDLFGSLLNAKREAQATLLQQDAYRQAVQSQIIATIATSYYALLMMDEQVRISDESVVIWREQVRTLEAQMRVGTVNENAVTQARANLYGLEASNAQLKQQQKETENALCSLLGRVSGTIERSTLAEQELRQSRNFLTRHSAWEFLSSSCQTGLTYIRQRWLWQRHTTRPIRPDQPSIRNSPFREAQDGQTVSDRRLQTLQACF